jgi:hypothetical protein
MKQCESVGGKEKWLGLRKRGGRSEKDETDKNEAMKSLHTRRKEEEERERQRSRGREEIGKKKKR